MAQKDVKLKLLIDPKGQRVLFAEADKDVVDFLFHLLSLPLGTVCRLLNRQIGLVGCLKNLYNSVATMNETYLLPNQNRDALLKPKVGSFCSSSLLLPDIVDSPRPWARFYVCGTRNCGRYFSDDLNAVCPECNRTMIQEGTYVKPPSGSTKTITTTEEEEGEGGYVKGVVTYMVMDDLTVMPMSTISTIALLNKFNIKEVNSLEERIIILDVNKGVRLLKASLLSKTVLTDVFLSGC